MLPSVLNVATYYETVKVRQVISSCSRPDHPCDRFSRAERPQAVSAGDLHTSFCKSQTSFTKLKYFNICHSARLVLFMALYVALQYLTDKNDGDMNACVCVCVITTCVVPLCGVTPCKDQCGDFLHVSAVIEPPITAWPCGTIPAFSSAHWSFLHTS